MPIFRRVPVVQATKSVTPSKNSAILTLVDAFGIEEDDSLKLSISDGFVSAHVKKQTGQVISHKMNLDKTYRQMIVVDGAISGPKDRLKIVKQLRKEGKSQAYIANILGVSQPTISLDLKKLGMK